MAISSGNPVKRLHAPHHEATLSNSVLTSLKCSNTSVEITRSYEREGKSGKNIWATWIFTIIRKCVPAREQDVSSHLPNPFQGCHFTIDIIDYLTKAHQ